MSLRKEIEQAADADIEKELQSIADPAREMEKSIQEIGQSLDEPAAPAAVEPAPSEPAPAELVKPEEAPAAPAHEPGGKKAGEAP